jgi:hypothetical protein
VLVTPAALVPSRYSNVSAVGNLAASLKEKDQKLKLEDRIGIVIVRHLGSRNPSYPDDSFIAKKFVALANELAKTLRQLPATELKKLTADEFWSITPQLVPVNHDQRRR